MTEFNFMAEALVKYFTYSGIVANAIIAVTGLITIISKFIPKKI